MAEVSKLTEMVETDLVFWPKILKIVEIEKLLKLKGDSWNKWYDWFYCNGYMVMFVKIVEMVELAKRVETSLSWVVPSSVGKKLMKWYFFVLKQS